MSEPEEQKNAADGVCKSGENGITTGDNSGDENGSDNAGDSDIEEVTPSGPLATTRSRRANAGNRMGLFIQEEEDAFYTNIYGGFEEEEDDEDFQDDEDDNKNMGKDDDGESSSDSSSSSGSSSESDSESSADEEDGAVSGNPEDVEDSKQQIASTTSDRAGGRSTRIDSKSPRKNKPIKNESSDVTSNSKFRPGSPSKLAYDACARICSVCLGDQSGDDDEVIECDSCGVTVHESCYGISVATEADEQDDTSVHSNISSESTEPWFCEPCRRSVRNPYCELCPNTGGVFKETDTGRWVHMVCALYTRGVTFENTDNLTGVSLFELSYALYGSKACVICEDRRLARSGVCIGCDAGLCKTFFHPTCAQKEGYLFESHSDEVDPYFAQCKQHADKSTVKRKKRKCTALFARLKRVQSNQEPSDRVKRKSSEMSQQSDSNLIKWTQENPPPIPVRTSKMLMTSPSLIINLTRKSELMGLDPNSAFMTVQDEIEMARQKWHIPPAYSLEFVAYCHDRTTRMDSMKRQNSELVKQNSMLKAEEATSREKYNKIEQVVSSIRADNESLIKEARALQRAVSLGTGKQFNLPIQMEQLIARCTNSKGKIPAKGNSKAASKANATYECIKCNTVKDQHLLALCDTCKFHIHIYCLDPPLSRVPKKTKFGGWQCSDCSEKDEEEQEEALDEQNLAAIQEADGPRRLRERIKYPDKYCHESMLMSDFWSTSKRKSKKSKKSSKPKQIKLEV